MRFTASDLQKADDIHTARAVRDWPQVGKVEEALAAQLAEPHAPLATERKEDTEESKPRALPYVAWLTPDRGTPQRVDIDPVTSKEEALKLARLAGQALFGSRPFASMVRPA